MTTAALYGLAAAAALAMATTASARASPLRPTFPAAAPAEPSRPGVVVAPIVFEGELRESFRGVVRDNLLEGLQRSDYAILDAGGNGEPEGLYVVRATMTVESRNYALVLELVDRNGEVIASSEDRCELCGIGEVELMVADQAAVLADTLQSSLKAQPVLVIESRPPGAVISLDGEVIGSTPLTLRVAAGQHRTHASLSGHFSQQLEVEAVEGMRQIVTLQLVAIPQGPTLQERRRATMAPWGVAALSVGTAALAAGVTLLVIDERPYQRQCGGADVDSDGNCRLLYDTQAGGIAATATGVAALAVGAALLGLAYGNGEARRRRSARLRIGGGRHAAALSR